VKILVVGGGPAGLYFARLRKRAHPSDTVILVEQNPPDVTYGFGVSIAVGAKSRYGQVDPELIEEIEHASYPMPNQRIAIDDSSYTIKWETFSGAIQRSVLLSTMQRACERVGVECHFGRQLSDYSAFEGFDLVVGADGANSFVRRSANCGFGTRNSELTNRFAWYGVNAALPQAGLSFKNLGGWALVGHYYPYSHSMSTFVAEVDAATWNDPKFGELADADRRKIFEVAFEGELMGSGLVENRSIWRSFGVVENDRSHYENRVLLGDALTVAHYSIGSGTRLAMDDAQGLYEVLEASTCEVPAALEEYERVRRSERDKLMSAARRSYSWYEEFRGHMNSPLLDFIYAFMSRTGRMGPDRLDRAAPQFLADYRKYLEGCGRALT